jgi:hypothetical protein
LYSIENWVSGPVSAIRTDEQRAERHRPIAVTTRQAEHGAFLELGDLRHFQRLLEENQIGDDDDCIAEEQEPAPAP